MRTYPLALMLVLGMWLTVLATPTLAGDISGSVSVKGLHSPAGVLVYLEDAPPADPGGSGAAFVMDQKDLTFRPHVLPIPVGTLVSFPNNDAVDHNVFSISRTKSFNFGSYKPGQSKEIVFDTPGVVEIRCDVHAEMLAYIVVLKNPHFGMTDDNGEFHIPDAGFWQAAGISGPPAIPPGEYVLKTWHEKLKTQKQTVSVAKDGPVEVKLELTRGNPGALYK